MKKLLIVVLFPVFVIATALWLQAGRAGADQLSEPTLHGTLLAQAGSPSNQRGYSGTNEEGGDRETYEAPLEAREIIEQLKTLRAQLLLEEEYMRLLEARIERQDLERQLEGAKEARTAPAARPQALRRQPAAPRRMEERQEDQIVVKSITVSPFKEAFVVYRGRTYTVRPGDQLGDIRIVDITPSGVVSNPVSGR